MSREGVQLTPPPCIEARTIFQMPCFFFSHERTWNGGGDAMGHKPFNCFLRAPNHKLKQVEEKINSANPGEVENFLFKFIFYK